ncbi:hypothetical protein B4121_3954 [Bacillus paralicheniformis]|uniref:Uncharacterized protein n=1 Tax=Bacillus paralicheniformis TaxID=1648923 RepID=A0A7Z0WU51_9BACI|nr:hypothetical protein B4121_3954 [Bacillus paralicheniformis]
MFLPKQNSLLNKDEKPRFHGVFCLFGSSLQKKQKNFLYPPLSTNGSLDTVYFT